MSHLLHVFPLISLHELTLITDAYHWNAHPGGHSITKHTGGWLEGLNQKPQTIYPKIAILKKMLKSYPLNILKVQSDSSKISNL